MNLLPAPTRIAARGRLARVVQLARQVPRVVRVQHGRVRVLDGPENRVRGARSRKSPAWRPDRRTTRAVLEAAVDAIRAFAMGNALMPSPDRAVVQRVVEVRGHREHAARQARRRCPDRSGWTTRSTCPSSRGRRRRCARPCRRPPPGAGRAGSVDQIGQHEGAARAEIGVGVGLRTRCRRSRSSRHTDSPPVVEILRNALPKLPWLGNPLALSVVSNVPLPVEQVDVAAPRRPPARRPPSRRRPAIRSA